LVAAWTLAVSAAGSWRWPARDIDVRPETLLAFKSKLQFGEIAMSAVHGQIRTEVHGHIFKIIIDNAAKKNSFTPTLMMQLSDAFTQLDNTEDLWVGVLCAEGADFTAGLDMPKFFGPTAERVPEKPDNVDPFALKKRCRKPIVTAVQGICFTIGIEIMLAGDIVVSADDARFCQMESKRGIAPLGGAHFRYLTRAGWGNAMYHLFLCDEFGAAEAHRCGFVQEVVQPGQQIPRAMEIAQLIAKNAPIGIQVTKEAGLKFIESGERAAIDYIPHIQDRVFKSEDMVEGIQSFVERRSAQFKGK
jgi:enoyl-CoA hydratase